MTWKRPDSATDHESGARPGSRVRRTRANAMAIIIPQMQYGRVFPMVMPGERRSTRSARSSQLDRGSRVGDRTAAVCAFSVTSRVTQRDGVVGRGHAGKPHLAAPRRPETHWRAPPRRSGGPDRLPKPGSLDDARLAPFRLPRITPGPQASGRQPAIQETS
jgi:hypothetical protein